MKRSISKVFWLFLASTSLVLGVSMTASAAIESTTAVPMHWGSWGTGGDEDHGDKKEDEKKDEKDKKDKKKDKKPE